MMLFFVDESGQDHGDAPYEVLAGIALREQDLWNLIQAVQSLEMEIFGVRLLEMGVELKGRKLLKTKTFRHAQGTDPIETEPRRTLCAEFLQKGRREALGGAPEPRQKAEFAAYGQAALAFVQRLYDLCGAYRAKIFAVIVDPSAPRPAGSFLRKDYSYLFERFYYFMEDSCANEMGIVVFDELEKAKCRILIEQMERYFADTQRGRIRSARIIPEPFFVHSDLTTAIQLVDIVAYSLNWGFRLPKKMKKPARLEMVPFGQLAFDLSYVGQRINKLDGQPWTVYGITYVDDLRPKKEKELD